MEPATAAWRSYSLASMACRLGNHTLAIERCERCQDYDRGRLSRAASIQLILAMAHAQQGQRSQARMDLAAGWEIVESHFPSGMVVRERWEGFGLTG